MSKKIIIGTRGSELALWQARYIQQLLLQNKIESELKIIVTSGDKNQQWESSFDKLEGKNFFTKEIEDALLKKEIDIAVHSFKDVEAVFFEDTNHPLIIAGLSKRHIPNDVLLLHKNSVDKKQLLHIASNAKVGTSSARRYAQLHTLRPDIQILPLRGNVPTRIQKLRHHQYDGIILAQAGIDRLNIPLNEFYVYPLPLHYFVPAAGQGIIAYQIHRDNKLLLSLIKKLTDTTSEECSKIERYLLKWMGGGCSKPIGILCTQQNKNYKLYISFNTDKNQTSLLTIYESNNTEQLLHTAQQNIQSLQNILKHPINKKILITKSLDPNTYLKRVAERLNWHITDEPLISTKKIETKELPDCNWIFFNSKNAVKYFIENFQKEKLVNKKIGCLSYSTAHYLMSYEINPHFIGKGNNIQDIAKQFVELCKDEIVVFPSSNISNQSIGNFIHPFAKVIYLPIYQTLENPKKFTTNFDYIIFTSPSNVRAFFALNSLTEKTIIIALGETTKQELVKHNINPENIHIPYIYDEIGIAAAILSQI